MPEETAVSSLRGLFEATRAALIGTQMQFELLMPDDDEPIELRAEALTLWCNGFVYGLGSGGAPDPERLPGDAGELVRNLATTMRPAGEDARGSYGPRQPLACRVALVLPVMQGFVG